MSDFDDDGDEEAGDFELRERVRGAVSGLEDAGRHCGLYMHHVDAALSNNGGPPLLMARFDVGDLAFTDRVLNPPAEDQAKVIRGMEVDARLDRFNEIARQAREGVGPLADLDKEDDE